ncbi:MAG: serine/threonine-protein phosphatase [Candidatus Adiutrix sp.]|jgi:serine/threonine protein phosphatase PrpC|nr:serine/threonine-protein phosphatase [Candidatus Adiutrix sp.]
MAPKLPARIHEVLGRASRKGRRAEQQDRFLVLYASGALFLLVADGLGGHSGGARAAEIVKKTARKMFLKEPLAPAESLFPAFMRQAWEHLRAEEARRTGLELRSTAVLIRLRGRGQAEWAHVGDSRLYLFNPEGELRQRTRDHSLATLAVFNGDMTEEEARRHPDRSILYQCLGGEKPPKPLLGRAEPPLEDGSLVLVCTDGFWEHVEPGREWFGQGRLADRVKATLAEAEKRAGQEADNATLLAFEYRADLFPES